MINTTLNRRTPSDEVPSAFREAVERQLRQAEKALEPGDPHTPRHLSAVSTFLDSLGDYGPDCSDPRIYALYLMVTAQDGIENFHLSPTQVRLIARLGDSPAPVPPPDVTFNELVTAGVEDLIESLRGDVVAAERDRATALADVADLAERGGECDTLKTELQEARETIDGLNGDLQEAQSSISYLQAQGRDEKPKAEAKPRRTKVEGETGIYHNEAVEGRPYEINWQDDEKKGHWRTLGHDLDEARAARAELTGQPFKELVAA